MANNRPHSLWSIISNTTEDVKTGCLNHNGATYTDGYGRVRYKGRQTQAHRAVYLLLHGDLPEHVVICHKCDNPKCVNPDHLFHGSQGDNIRDCHRKGRAYDGGRKLSDANVREIRTAHANGENYRIIAKRFNINANYIFAIVNRKRAAHVL